MSTSEIAYNWLSWVLTDLAPFLVPLLVVARCIDLFYKRVGSRGTEISNISNVSGQTELDPYLQTSATELARHILRGNITSEKLIALYEERLCKVNVSLNAVVVYRFEQAREEAKQCDIVVSMFKRRYGQLRAEWFAKHGSEDPLGSISGSSRSMNSLKPQEVLSGIVDPATLVFPDSKLMDLEDFLQSHLPPFFGVPCTTKESFALKGQPLTAGLVSRKDVVAQYTSPVIRNMQRAGLIILGTTTTSELCMWLESSNNVYGLVRNPYDLARTAGGSSGGEGSIIAAQGSILGLGSDVGGSIRMPAFFNGIYGHKPTSGYVSNAGQWPLLQGTTELYCQPGPMARYPADLWPLLQTMVQTHEFSSLSTEDEPNGRRTVQLLPRDYVFQGKSHGISAHGYLVDDAETHEHDSRHTLSYVHSPLDYGHTDRRVLTSLDSHAADILTSLHSSKTLYRIVPWKVDVSRLTVYSLKDFGTASVYCRAVTPEVQQQQRAATIFLATLGCKVVEIDIDELAKNSLSSVQTLHVTRGQVSSEIVLDTKPLKFLTAFKDSFKLWSSGMACSDGPSFRDMLLQPVPVRQFSRKGFAAVISDQNGILQLREVIAAKTNQSVWERCALLLGLHFYVPTIPDVAQYVETPKQGGQSVLVCEPEVSKLSKWTNVINEVKIHLFLLYHMILALCNFRIIRQLPSLAQRYGQTYATTSEPSTIWQRVWTFVATHAPYTNYTFPALGLAVVELVPKINPQSNLKTFDELQTFSTHLSTFLDEHEHGAIMLCPPHTRQAPTHKTPYLSPFDCAYTSAFNATRMPVTSVPLGVIDGLPTGTQVCGARHADNLTIAVALALHSQFGGWMPVRSVYQDQK